MLVDIHTLLDEHIVGLSLAMVQKNNRWKRWPHVFPTDGRNLKSALFNPEHVEAYLIKKGGVNYIGFDTNLPMNTRNKTESDPHGVLSKVKWADSKG